MVTISACYITKNGEEFLDFSMKSVKEFVDEIIIVDDQSNDKTLDIAHKNGAYIIQGVYDGDKRKQRNEYLKEARGEWILVVDDDEIYKKDEIAWLRKWIESEASQKYNTIRYPLYHFWKSPNKIITGHMWNQMLERCFRNMEGLIYNVHHTVSDKEGRFLNGSSYYKDTVFVTDNIHIYHYSYLKNPEYIRNKIRYYMLRDNPNCNIDNVDEWVNRHPYFSGNFSQPRYGENGLYVAGEANGHTENVIPFKGEHPCDINKHPSFYHEYLVQANKYMEEHWQYNNHLNHPRHQARIKEAAQYCIGRTLEVGCANGFSTHLLQQTNPEAKFEGVEPTDWGYGQAIKNYPDIKFYKEMGESLSFDDGEFDTVLLAEIIEHCMIPKALVDEAWRVTNKRLIITTPTKPHPDPDHKRHFSIQDMEEFLQHYGKPWFTGLTEQGNKPKNADEIYFMIAVVDKCTREE